MLNKKESVLEANDNAICWRYDSVLIAFLMLSFCVSALGGVSLAADFNKLGVIGLDWDASLVGTGTIPKWIFIVWVLSILFAPLAMYNGFFGISLYCFATLSIQGSEPAAKCLNNDGFRLWLLLFLGVSFLIGKYTGRNAASPEARRILRHPLFLSLSVLNIWVFVSWITHFITTGISEPIHYRQPILWIDCLVVFWMITVELGTKQKRLLFIAFLAFTLAWRVFMTTDSVLLEGHVSSYIAMLVPWAFFSIFPFTEKNISGLGYAILGASLFWLLGPSLDGVLSNMGNQLLLISGWKGFLAGTTVIAIVLTLVFLKKWQSVFFLMVFVAGLVAVVLIANRASGLAIAFWLLSLPIVFPAPVKIKALVALLGIGLVSGMSFYTPLVDRFRGIWTSGSGLERFNLWRMAWDLVQSNPILGVGPGQFSTLVQELDSSIDEPLDVHNTWLEVLCEIGWPGAILFSFFWSGLVLLSLLTIGKPSSDFVNPNTWNRIRVRLDETWEQRATLSFFLIYFVVGLFGSRHNLPLAYMLAGVGFSKIASVKRESD